MLESGHGTQVSQAWLKEVLTAKVTESQCWWEKDTPQSQGPGTEGSPCCRSRGLEQVLQVLQVLQNWLPGPMPSQPTFAWAAQVICDSWAGADTRENHRTPTLIVSIIFETMLKLETLEEIRKMFPIRNFQRLNLLHAQLDAGNMDSRSWAGASHIINFMGPHRFLSHRFHPYLLHITVPSLLGITLANLMGKQGVKVGVIKNHNIIIIITLITFIPKKGSLVILLLLLNFHWVILNQNNLGLGLAKPDTPVLGERIVSQLHGIVLGRSRNRDESIFKKSHGFILSGDGSVIDIILPTQHLNNKFPPKPMRDKTWEEALCASGHWCIPLCPCQLYESCSWKAFWHPKNPSEASPHQVQHSSNHEVSSPPGNGPLIGYMGDLNQHCGTTLICILKIKFCPPLTWDRMNPTFGDLGPLCKGQKKSANKIRARELTETLAIHGTPTNFLSAHVSKDPCSRKRVRIISSFSQHWCSSLASVPGAGSPISFRNCQLWANQDPALRDVWHLSPKLGRDCPQS